MYIAQAYNVLHDWWRYIVGVLISIVGIFVFSIPHFIGIAVKTLDGTVDQSKLEDTNYLMTLFEPNVNLVFILLPFAGGLIFLLGAAKLLHKQSFTSLTTARPKIDWKRFWFSFIFWGIVSSSMVLLDYYLSPEDYVFNFNLVPFLILCVIAIALVPLQTSFEEYLFRGYLMQGIGVSSTRKYFPFVLIFSLLGIFGYIFLAYFYHIGFWISLLYFLIVGGIIILFLNSSVAEKLSDSTGYKNVFLIFNRNTTPLLITSFVFGMLHIANPEVEKLGYIIMVYYIGTGLFLGIMTLMDEGLELALGFHAANNLFTALLVTADWTAFQTHSVLKDMSDPKAAEFLDIFMPVFVIFPILLFIFAKKYNWTNWKEKLFGRVEQPPKEDYKILEDINEIGTN